MEIREISREEMIAIYVSEKLTNEERFLGSHTENDFVIEYEKNRYKVYMDCTKTKMPIRECTEWYNKDIVDIYFMGLNKRDRKACRSISRKDEKIKFIEIEVENK